MTDQRFPIFGTGIAPLIGREAIMDRLWRELTKSTPNHLQVVGPRFGGKTVLLHALAKRMRGEISPFEVVVLWDLGHQTPDSNDAFLLQLCAQVADVLNSSGSDYTSELRDLNAEDAYDQLKEVLEVLGTEDTRLLLLLDGFDKPLAGVKLTRNLWDQLRELGSLSNVRFVTASRQPLSRLIRSEDAATSDFWNIFDQNPVRVACFDDDDLDEILEKMPFTLDRGAHSELINWTGRFPLLTLSLLNELCRHHEKGAIGAQEVNECAEGSGDYVEASLSALWRDCPSVAQDVFRDLLAQGNTTSFGISVRTLSYLEERGFVARSGNKIQPSCRYLQAYLSRSSAESGGMERLFGTWDLYASNIRELLERRLAQLERVDERLRRLVARSIEDIPDYPDDCLNSLTNIQELALDVIWVQEFGAERLLPQGHWDTWNWCDGSNRTVQDLKVYAGRKVPPDRFLQCRMLQLLTGSRARFDPKARFATKDMYALIDAMHTFRNRSQHGDGEPMHVGVAVAALMLCIELLACIDRRMAADCN